LNGFRGNRPISDENTYKIEVGTREEGRARNMERKRERRERGLKLKRATSSVGSRPLYLRDRGNPSRLDPNRKLMC
jgi:hypothetical protein